MREELHLSIYKKGSHFRIALLPKDVTSKVLAPVGGLLRRPVVHTIDVAVAVLTTHGMPSIKTEIEAGRGSKLVPVIVTEVPPTLGPNDGVILVMVVVFASWYVTAAFITIFFVASLKLIARGQAKLLE